MRRLLRFLLLRPITWIIERFASAPDRQRIFAALSELQKKLQKAPGKKGFVIPFELNSARFIVFSDQHKGRKNGADDFLNAEPAYLQALSYYDQQKFHLINLGDCEELWENTLLQVMKRNRASFEAERKFVARNAFTKIFGNHDLDWDIDPLAPAYLKDIYGQQVVALEAVMLQTTVDDRKLDILCTHGHQGDLQSDGNWFSKFIVAKIWAPFQSYLRINPNTPAYDKYLKNLHNTIMYEWSASQKNLLLITGHTHQPVFESLTHLERLNRNQKRALWEHNREWAEALDLEIQWRKKDDDEVRYDYLKMKPTYFNTGCCCYIDGDITGIEISDGSIRLIKWKMVDGKATRIVSEERKLTDIVAEIAKEISLETIEGQR